jgi:hypothetical protein
MSRKARVDRSPEEKRQIIHEATHHINAGVSRGVAEFDLEQRNSSALLDILPIHRFNMSIV